MRLWLSASLGLLLILSACAGPAASTGPAPMPTPMPLVAELLAAPTLGPHTLTAMLLVTLEGAALVEGLSLTGAVPEVLGGSGIWLGTALLLPAELSLEGPDEARYAVVQASGQLEGPGQYGPDGRYGYQLVAPRVVPQTFRELSLGMLLTNSGLYTNQPVRLSGSVLATPDSALLADQLGTGGVPAGDALLLKLDGPLRDPTVVAQLQPSGDGRVRFGPITVLGIWRGNQLHPLIVTNDG
ncbi:MAG: hypothetical protein AB4911_14255 [Oscillochloridaceae bacterium umkhey_bin13]